MVGLGAQDTKDSGGGGLENSMTALAREAGEARPGQQGAVLGGLMTPLGCLGEDRQNSRGSSPSATPGWLRPLEHGPNLRGPLGAPVGGGAAARRPGDGGETAYPLPELLQLGSGVLGALPSHSRASCGSFVLPCPLVRRGLSANRHQPTHPDFPTTTQGQKPAAAQPTPAGEEG